MAAIGAVEGAFTASARVSEVATTATYVHAYVESTGLFTLVSDGHRLTGAYALGPEAGEWLQQATLDVLRDPIQPFPLFSEISWRRSSPRTNRPPRRGRPATAQPG
ncbi:hypothetical protein [Amycolatopsis sp. FDAARGOS 1241]|uniref:hypothetical protein n=1 Tax=Amycolatopsis sp. FDAARGOS 1241 TaxID=2778070 RepID=UPI00195147DC|nr:hypothetical protein [Amycolatopsis sp. FDAARGOS 1241]QRP50047.1 hypothetical protein I6J71_21405 [Amycolatopsis sp. FDAARGOS 1241]